MSKLATAITAGALLQMVLVPTPGGQYDNGRNSYVMMPQVYTQPRALPPQFNPGYMQQQQQQMHLQHQVPHPCYVPGPATC